MKFRNQIANFQDVMKHVEINNGCYEWQKSRTKAGYGRMMINGNDTYIHRLVAEMFYGKPNKNLHVLHSCDNPPCCNPNHLRWGTRHENMQDASKRGRLSTGEGHHLSKLTLNEVKQIRNRRIGGERLSSIATDYGVSISAVSYIAAGKVWKNA